MTYPQGSSGYSAGQQPTQQFSAPTQQFGKLEQQHQQPSQAQTPAPTAAGPSKLPFILLAAVAALGLLVYLFSFGPMFTLSATDFGQLGEAASGSSLGLGLAVLTSVLAGLLAGVGLLPKQRIFVGVVAAISVLAFLLVIGEIVNTPAQVSIGWALYVVIGLTLLQAGAAIWALLLDAGILAAPAPKPAKYEQPQQQYGGYGAPGQYYGQPGQHAPHQGGPQQQRPGYPSQYGGGYQGGSSSGGFPSIGGGGQHSQHSGPPTPPTGFPTYGQPQAPSSAPTSQVPAQPSSSSSSSSSNQSGNASSSS
jgi:hypothetical protein